MEDFFANILFLVFIGGVLVLAVSLFFYYQFLERRAFMTAAAQLDFKYYYRSYAIPRRFAFLRQQRRGRGRHAFNILHGSYQGAEMLAFDYQFSTGMGKEKTWHYCSFAVMRHDCLCPSLRIYPQAMMPVLGQIVGYEEILFDSPDFTEKFAVFATDELFARAVCHTPLISYMLSHPELSVEVESEWMAIGMAERSIPEEIPRRIRQLQKIRVMLPL